MPRSQAVLHFDWLEGLDGCTDDEILLYCTILTEPTVNQAGVGALRLSLWARRRGRPVVEIETALKGLDAKRYVFVDDRTEEILVRTLIRRDGVASQPNLLWAAVRQAPLTRSPRLRQELAAELRKLPPQRPDTIVKKTGRVFVHADPHAVADVLDPPPPPVDNSPGEPIENPSRTHREGFSGEGFSNPSRTLGGGGGGGGGGSTPVGGPVGGPRAARSTSSNHPQDDPQPALGLLAAVPAIPDEPPRCRKHCRLPAAVDPGPCPGCAGERHRWERQRAEHRAETAAAVQAARAGCARCDTEGWLLEHPGGPPVEPARRCDHRPLHAVQPDHPKERPA